MDSEFIGRLLARAEVTSVAISPAQADRLLVYAELLARWNQRINLTALPLEGWPDQSLDRLFLEPLSAVPLVASLAGRWIDLGSGGGSPALPLAIATEGLDLTLTESRGKKAAFLREALRALRLERAEVRERFEELFAWPSRSVQLITCRAVRFEDTLQLSSHLLATDGLMLFFGEVASPVSELVHKQAQQSTVPNSRIEVFAQL